MLNFRKLPRTVFYSTLIFTNFGFVLSIIYSTISVIFICPTTVNCPSNPIPIILLVLFVTFIFFIFGLIFGVILLKLYDLFRVE